MEETIGIRLPLSVSIISFNEEHDIGRTLENILDIASEIIVVDSHSTDRTREIASRLGAQVFEEDWKGHIGQKNSALAKCTREWILCLDCDEVVSPELKDSIIHAVQNPDADGFIINRKTNYLGEVLEYAWQPDLKLRLVRRSAHPRWGGYNPHDVLMIDGKTKRLKGDLFHYSYTDVEDHFTKVVKYSKLVAGEYARSGKRFHFSNLILNPLFAFFKEYILKKGFLNGIRGLGVAVSVTFYTFLKYYYLWETQRVLRKP